MSTNSYIKINGELIGNAFLSTVEVTQELNHHWWCRVECRQTDDVRFPVEGCLGKSLQIVTFDQDGAQHVVFDGMVLDAELVYEIYGSYTARLTGVTKSYKLDLTAQEKYFRKQDIKQVASQLTGEDGLTAQVECEKKPIKNYVQWGETDFSFLNRLADDSGAWLRPTAEGIEIRDTFQQGTTLKWRTEEGLLSFTMRGKLAQPSFNGTHYNSRAMESKSFQKINKPAQFFGASGPMVNAVRQQSEAALPPGFLFVDSRAATATEYHELLERESVRAMGANLTGSGISRNQLLKPGNTVEIQGNLDAAGTYGVIKVVHTWTAQGYTNEFLCTPWKNYVNPKQPLPVEMRGVVSARVTDHNDPRGMGRIKIKYDWQEDGDSSWVRMVTPHSGGGRGIMFMPEIGDEVLVDFEQGDPERPVIVGCLWNGVDSAPREGFWDSLGTMTPGHDQPQQQQQADPAEFEQPEPQHMQGQGGARNMKIPVDIANNDVKRIVTKSGHRIQFVDSPGKESMVLATPGGQTIKMIDTCPQTGGRKMLSLESPGDIFINAAGRVHIRCQFFSREVG